MEQQEATGWSEIDKEELFDVISALAANIRVLTNEVIELGAIILELQEPARKLLPGQTKLGVVN